MASLTTTYNLQLLPAETGMNWREAQRIIREDLPDTLPDEARGQVGIFVKFLSKTRQDITFEVTYNHPSPMVLDEIQRDIDDRPDIDG